MKFFLPILMCIVLFFTAYNPHMSTQAVFTQETSPQDTSSQTTSPKETEVDSKDESLIREIIARDRIFYKYDVVTPKMLTTSESFANPTLIEKAIACVKDKVKPVGKATFKEGFFYDVDRDGQKEAIIVIYASQGDGNNWFWGDHHSVFIDSSGVCHFLESGCHMKFDIIRYKDFTHFAMRTGNQTAASGNYFEIYSVSGTTLKEEYQGFWYDYFNNTFFTMEGPQGMNTEFFFWDSVFEKYNLIIPKGISWEQFIKETNFDEKIVREYSYEDGTETLVSIEDILKDFEVKNIFDISACGNAIYSLYVEATHATFISFFLSEDYTYSVDQTMYRYDEPFGLDPYTQDIDVIKAIKNAVPVE